MNSRASTARASARKQTPSGDGSRIVFGSNPRTGSAIRSRTPVAPEVSSGSSASRDSFLAVPTLFADQLSRTCEARS